jgi:hypothetical protein
MKNQNRSKAKKLSLNKEKIVSLNKAQLKSIHGGDGVPPVTIHTDPTGLGGVTLNCG